MFLGGCLGGGDKSSAAGSLLRDDDAGRDVHGDAGHWREHEHDLGWTQNHFVLKPLTASENESPLPLTALSVWRTLYLTALL